MSITNYTELKASVADWLNREDLTAQIPDFITFAEARLNRTLRTREMLTRRRTVTTDGFIGLPPDYLETYQLQLPANATNTPEPLTFIGPDEAARFKATSMTGKTRYYTIIDGAFELIPTPSSSVELTITYYAKVPALSSTQATNWLLTKAPDLYLYATLANAAPYLQNDERIPVWSQLASSAFDELMMDSERASRSRTNLTARRRGF
jgi:hypothetical protein